MRGFVVVPFTPSDPTWPALAAASLTSVDGQRDPCIVLSDPAAYVQEGDDLGGAQRLAVMSAGGARLSQRASVGLVPPCGWHAERRPLQSLQSELDAAIRQRPAVALLRLGQPGGQAQTHEGRPGRVRDACIM